MGSPKKQEDLFACSLSRSHIIHFHSTHYISSLSSTIPRRSAQNALPPDHHYKLMQPFYVRSSFSSL